MSLAISVRLGKPDAPMTPPLLACGEFRPTPPKVYKEKDLPNIASAHFTNDKLALATGVMQSYRWEDFIQKADSLRRPVVPHMDILQTEYAT